MFNPTDSQVGNVEGSDVSLAVKWCVFDSMRPTGIWYNPLASVALGNLSEKLSAYCPDSSNLSLMKNLQLFQESVRAPQEKDSLIQSLRGLSLSTYNGASTRYAAFRD